MIRFHIEHYLERMFGLTKSFAELCGNIENALTTDLRRIFSFPNKTVAFTRLLIFKEINSRQNIRKCNNRENSIGFVHNTQ